MSLEAAIARLDRYIARSMEEWAVPGLALAVTDRKETLHLAEYGLADIASQRPVSADTLFQIGSVSKSFAGLAVLPEVEAGRLDLHRPVTDYLPWCPCSARVTLHRLLTHTSGLVAGMEASSSTIGEVLALARAESDPPGAFRYSNVGYSIVGLVLERVAGQQIADVLASSVLGPAGMAASSGAITNELRPRLAVGHVPADSGRPWHPSLPLAPAPWFESDSAAGSVCSTAEDMAAYARLLLNRGAGVVSPASFDCFATAHAELEPGIGYGYGIAIEERPDRVLLGHGGTMVGYSASLDTDLRAGVGVAVLSNHVCPAGTPRNVVDAALGLVTAAVEGRDLPEPEPPDRRRITNAGDYAGVYRGPKGEVVAEVDGDRLALVRGRERAMLERYENDVFYPVGDEPASFLLRFGREEGTVVELCDGPGWYASERYAGPLEFEAPSEWAAYVGRYCSYSPWLPGFRIVQRKNGLVFIGYDGAEGALEPLGEATFRRHADDELPSRVAFGDVIEGQAARARCDGADYYRAFTP